jgi:carboxypeptidase Q
MYRRGEVALSKRSPSIRKDAVLFFSAALILAGAAALHLHAAQRRAEASATDDAEQGRLEAIAGAGMVGSHTFNYLADLSDGIGARVTGSPEAKRAIDWGVATMKSIGLENVHAESWQLWRGWTRGSAEAELLSPIHRSLLVDSMGWVGSTPAGGADANVIEVDMSNMAAEISQNSGNWAGKVLLVVRKAPSVRGPGDTSFTDFGKFLEAAYKARAIAVIGGQAGNKATGMHITHTGILGFAVYYDVPVVSMGAEDQSQLERLVESGKNPRIHINVQNAVTPGPVESANVVGDIRGTEHPEQIIVVGGHLDSWDLSTGTTDDGCGVATTLGAAEAIIRSGVRPKRTIRFVLFTGEEQGLLGSLAYVKTHQPEMPNHVAAVILDSGQGPVVGMDIARDDLVDAVRPFADSLAAFGKIQVSDHSEFGTDAGPFTLAGLPGIDLSQDSPDYRYTHHSSVDTLDKVDPAIMDRDATVMALTSFWLADRPERLAAPRDGETTRQMLIKQHMDAELKAEGLWDLIGDGPGQRPRD